MEQNCRRRRDGGGAQSEALRQIPYVEGSACEGVECATGEMVRSSHMSGLGAVREIVAGNVPSGLIGCHRPAPARDAPEPALTQRKTKEDAHQTQE
jgi:hypothetical protein